MELYVKATNAEYEKLNHLITSLADQLKELPKDSYKLRVKKCRVNSYASVLIKDTEIQSDGLDDFLVCITRYLKAPLSKCYIDLRKSI